MEESIAQLERELFCAERNFVEHYNIMKKEEEHTDCWRKEIKSLILRIEQLNGKKAIIGEKE